MSPKLLSLGLALGTFLGAAHAATLTVTTANNASPGPNQMSLVMALQQAQAGDTIAFNIPGNGPHYITTPVDGYPIIRQRGLTIDGYSQPGAAPNTNALRAPNTARLQIVLDSRQGGRTKMNYNTGRPGYGDSENAILGVFNAPNVTIRGLCFLGAYTTNSDEDPAIYCVAFARDHSGEPDYDNGGHVSGCWFGVEPDGKSVTGGSAAGVTAFRHRDVSGGTLPELPNHDLTLGVRTNSPNPRAEFNVIVAQSYALAGEQTMARVSGNFIGVLPDGVTPYDITAQSPDNFGGASIEIGRYSDSLIVIGTDGDGTNDSDEGNVFGPLGGGQRVVSFYTTNNKRFIIAGNYFGIGVDGTTVFPGSFQILGSGFAASTVQFGSNFDGISDAWEGNWVANNHPWDPGTPVINPIAASAGAFLSVRGNTLVNNFPLPVNLAAAGLGLTNPDPATFYTPHLVATEPLVIQPKIESVGTHLVGTAPLPAESFTATIIDLYEADPEGIDNGKDINLPELPSGFVQGRTYLASFVDNSPADLAPEPGVFRFDLGALDLGGKNVTITANYSVEAAGTRFASVVTTPFSEPVVATASERLTLSVQRNSNGTLTLSWPASITGVTVESKNALTDATWSTVPGTTGNSATITVRADRNEFFRLRK